jgi:hypothetical protein
MIKFSEKWSDGVLGNWSVGIMEHWSTGVMGYFPE